MLFCRDFGIPQCAAGEVSEVAGAMRKGIRFRSVLVSAFLLGAGAVAPSVAQEKAPAKPPAVAPEPPPTTKGGVTKESGAKEKSAAPDAAPARFTDP